MLELYGFFIYAYKEDIDIKQRSLKDLYYRSKEFLRLKIIVQ